MICHFMVGIPGSGKSTVAQQLADLTQGLIISTDRIREQLYGDEIIQGNWLEIERKVLQEMEQAIASSQPIIYDATNTYRHWRLDILEKAALIYPEIPRSWIAWVLETPIETCKLRNQNRQRQVPESVIEQMGKAIADFPPTPSEGFIKVYSLKPDYSELKNRLEF
ncbi:ATP-binding protein [Planktothrix agardhii]|uniref:ATP-binding protein n=1 Tax=Planktothrix agardhii TaxID=1160 RepID=UPI001BDFDB16|nr:ATP-binding protein [Planktothrix agardhii]